jgi:hypothetical protein
MAIIITKNGQESLKLNPSNFEEEAELQSYIANNPDSLPLYEIKEDIHLLIIAREFSTSSGPIDALGLDRDGDIYIIETKFYKNPDKRIIVAQLLDYAASLWRNSDYKSFMEEAKKRARELFNEELNAKIGKYFGLEDAEIDQLFDKINSNLQSGSFHFVVLMDKIHDRLKDLIIFLNQNTSFDIFAVEVEYYKFDQYEIVIPKLFGAEVRKELSVISKSGERRKWDEISFFEDAKKLSPENFKILQSVYQSCKNVADTITWGTGMTHGSFNPKYLSLSVRSPFSIYSSGQLQVSFGYLPEDEKGQNFRKAWTKILMEDVKLKFDPDSEYFYLSIDDWGPKADTLVNSFTDLLSKYK